METKLTDEKNTGDIYERTEVVHDLISDIYALFAGRSTDLGRYIYDKKGNISKKSLHAMVSDIVNYALYSDDTDYIPPYFDTEDIYPVDMKESFYKAYLYTTILAAHIFVHDFSIYDMDLEMGSSGLGNAPYSYFYPESMTTFADLIKSIDIDLSADILTLDEHRLTCERIEYYKEISSLIKAEERARHKPLPASMHTDIFIKNTDTLSRIYPWFHNVDLIKYDLSKGIDIYIMTHGGSVANDPDKHFLAYAELRNALIKIEEIL